MMIGSSNKQHSLHLSISNDYSNIKDGVKVSKSQKGNVQIKNQLAQSIKIKKNDPIDNLMKEKQNIIDSKKKYLENALSKHESSDSIKENIAEYDKKTSEIDKQISNLKLEELKKALSTDDKDTKNAKTKDNLNKDETQNTLELDKSNEMMNNLVSLSSNISANKTLSSVKTSAIGEKNNLENEIETDKGRSDSTFQKNRVSALDDNINNIQRIIGKNLNDINGNSYYNSTDISKNAISTSHESENSNESTTDESVINTRVLHAINNYKENDSNKTQANGQICNSII